MPIKSKEVRKFKKQKEGIYLGNEVINLSFTYDIGDYYGREIVQARKEEWQEVARVVVKGIKKIYLVPLENLKGENENEI